MTKEKYLEKLSKMDGEKLVEEFYMVHCPECDHKMIVKK